MTEQGIVRSPRAANESGFALVLAILALMLLTFLGLTMAATTSTELQIATNYRWSQQALYNAEAGLEAAKIILAPKGILDWNAQLPVYRLGPWNYGAGAPPTAVVPPSRDYERSGPGCQDRSGVGYGLVLTIGGVPYQNQTSFQGANLNGAFTIWIRRDTLVNGGTGQFTDNPDNTSAIITSEGVAPYAGTFGNAAVQTFARTNQAVRFLETGFTLVTSQKSKRCQTGLAGQEGLAASGENFDPCSPLDAAGITGALGLPSATDSGKR